MKKALTILAFVSILINIFLVAFFIKSKNNKIIDTNEVIRSELPFLSQRIFVENKNDIIINFTDLRKKINEYLKGVKVKIGLYFEYLPSGVSIGINEKEQFVWASLLKVPLAMAIYKQVENGQLSLSDKLTIKESNLNKNFGDLWKKGSGVTITVEEAIHLMLVESDNTAKSVLFDQLPATAIEEVFEYLDIPKVLEGGQNTPVVTAKNYSSILRSLYLSSYLSKEFSNDILELLTKTPFDDKLRAGIPDNIKVAHKIGVHANSPSTTDIRSVYTDCGIIYYPKRPYIVCLMIQSSESEAQKRMKDLSNLIYTYISEINKITP